MMIGKEKNRHYKLMIRYFETLSPVKTPLVEQEMEKELYFPSLLYDLPNRCINDPCIVGKIPREETKIATVVFDLDETLVTYYNNYIYVRPYARVLLSLLKENFPNLELIVWSAAAKSHVNFVVELLDPDNNIFSHCICRSSPQQEAIPDKNISLLNRTNIIIIDDLIYAGVSNGLQAIILPKFLPYYPQAKKDTTILYVLQIIGRAMFLLDGHHRGCHEEMGFPEWWKRECSERKIPLHGLDTEKLACLSTNPLIYFITDHPFIETVVTDCVRGKITYSYLNVCDVTVIAKRIETFRSLLGVKDDSAPK